MPDITKGVTGAIAMLYNGPGIALYHNIWHLSAVPEPGGTDFHYSNDPNDQSIFILPPLPGMSVQITGMTQEDTPILALTIPDSVAAEDILGAAEITITYLTSLGTYANAKSALTIYDPDGAPPEEEPPLPPGTPTTSGPPVGVCLGASVPLTWTSVPNAVTYNVHRNGIVIASGIVGLTYTDNTVVIGQAYSYGVSATNAAGTSAPSPAIVINPCLPPEEEPPPGPDPEPEHNCTTWTSSLSCNTEWTGQQPCCSD